MTNEAALYAYAFRLKGYFPYPVNVGVDGRGDKTLTFKDNRWADGEYPMEKEAIGRHWEGFSGVMLNTGKSGIVVVDIDRKKGEDGYKGLADAGIELPETPMWAETPNEGGHRFYRAPEGVDVKTCAGILAPGVDIRAKGGLVLTAPTEVPGKGAYKLHNVTPVDGLPEFPRELVAKLAPRETEDRTERPRPTERPMVTPEKREWLEKTADKILRELRQMDDGERFGTMQRRMVRLYGIAMTLGEDLDIIDAQVRGAYYYSGGGDTSQLEGWIRWAREHADYEEVEDEDREAEIQAGIRREQIKKEIRHRLNPVQVTSISDDDVLTFNTEDEGPRWWVDEWLPKGVTGILYAPPNTGKSFAAVDLACGVASGTWAWSQRVPQGKVLYLAGEGHAGLPIRQKAWEHWRGVEAGSNLELRKMRLLLRDEESVAEHVRLVKETGADLIIVDTLMRATAGMTLETPGEASLAIHHLDMIREAGGPDASLLVLHHPAKSNPDVPAGSFPIAGNVDTMIGMRERDDDKVLTLWLEKARDSDKIKYLQFKPKPIEVPGTNRGALVLEGHIDGEGVTYVEP